MKTYAILIDTSYCTGCNTCSYRCIQEFRSHTQATNGLFRTFVAINDGGLYHKRCMHCFDPECVKVCPVNALSKSEYGPVLYDQEKCIGCQSCVKACPFSIPQYDEKTQKILKCSLCAHRIAENKEPACAEACPTGAIQFGESKAILGKAKEIAKKRKMTIYGLSEASGTHTYILTIGSPKKAGYIDVKKGVPKIKKSSIESIGAMPIVAGAIIGGLKKLEERKRKIAEENKNKD
ncbi:MAG TPA: 4Fe-4S binding protein [Syntrophorhabdaceae bacterium]|nr:4Fe-4S binding protein [Syntrophorhabdaceae bacterium]HPU30424.1 4Fe-4S binding protein [Syntrophorhabdaceae bacterium]